MDDEIVHITVPQCNAGRSTLNTAENMPKTVLIIRAYFNYSRFKKCPWLFGTLPCLQNKAHGTSLGSEYNQGVEHRSEGRDSSATY